MSASSEESNEPMTNQNIMESQCSSDGISTCLMGPDLFERLPDDILILIISMMSFKEAARTSVFCRRWKHLWAFYPGPLHLPEKHINLVYGCRKQLHAVRKRFVAMVNKILSSHRAQTVSELTVYDSNNFSKEYEDDIDGWLDFARERKVKMLTLNFGFGCVVSNWRYEFPPKRNNCFTSLEKLRLSMVNVRGGDLNQLLSSCPNLEVLVVRNSIFNGTLRVSVPSLKLKELQIVSCYKLHRVEVSVENLTCFGYTGRLIDIVFTNTKKLVDLYLAQDCIFCERPVDLAILPQIQTLTLDAKGQHILCPILPYAVFNKLKRLQLKVVLDGMYDVLQYLSLVKAAPMLFSFVIELSRYDPSPEIFDMDDIENVLPEKVGKSTHSNLKNVILDGFLGYESETRLALCLAGYALSLSSMTVFIGCRQNEYYVPALGLKSWTLQQVEKLKARLPRQVQLEAHDRFYSVVVNSRKVTDHAHTAPSFVLGSCEESLFN